MDAAIDTLTLTVTPMVFDCLHQESLDDWELMPDEGKAMDFHSQEFSVSKNHTIRLVNEAPQMNGGWVFWLELDSDLSTEWQTVGSLCFGIAADELFTARITQSW